MESVDISSARLLKERGVRYYVSCTANQLDWCDCSYWHNPGWIHGSTAGDAAILEESFYMLTWQATSLRCDIYSGDRAFYVPFSWLPLESQERLCQALGPLGVSPILKLSSWTAPGEIFSEGRCSAHQRCGPCWRLQMRQPSLLAATIRRANFCEIINFFGGIWRLPISPWAALALKGYESFWIWLTKIIVAVRHLTISPTLSWTKHDSVDWPETQGRVACF